MKDKENLFKRLRAAVETPAESTALDNFIRKINREMPPIEIVDDTHKKFDGLVYRKHKHDERYYFSTSLARSVWKFFNGEIPDGYEVHHLDDNKDNDDISNLTLLTREEHLKLHSDRRRGVKTFREPKPKTFVCEFCGKQFTALTTNGCRRYCSDKCRNRHQEKNENRFEDRVCQFCGKTFKACKYKPTRFCSKDCGYASRRKAKS